MCILTDKLLSIINQLCCLEGYYDSLLMVDALIICQINNFESKLKQKLSININKLRRKKPKTNMTLKLWKQNVCAFIPQS